MANIGAIPSNTEIAAGDIANRTRTAFATIEAVASGVNASNYGYTIEATDETTRTAAFTMVVPNDFASSGSLVVYYSGSSTGTINITLSAVSIAVNAALSFDEYNGSSQTLSCAAADTLYKATFALANVAAGDLFSGFVARRTGDANTGTLRVRAIGIEYTADM